VHLISRQPIILDPEDESKWLQDDTPMNFILSMLRSYPADKMDAYPISNLVNSPSNNSPDIIKPLAA
jgi:putative SOS response-associated peptidase YedK